MPATGTPAFKKLSSFTTTAFDSFIGSLSRSDVHLLLDFHSRKCVPLIPFFPKARHSSDGIIF